MEINFIDLVDIDQELYKKAILTYITDHFYHEDFDVYLNLAKTKINLYPLGHHSVNPLFYQHSYQEVPKNFNIPHGNTGLNVCNIYIYDNLNEMYTAMNFQAISHELAHLILMLLKSNEFVTYVHEIQDKNLYRTLNIPYRLGKARIRMLDITAKTDSRNEDLV